MKITCVYLEDSYENDPKSFYLNYFIESLAFNIIRPFSPLFVLCIRRMYDGM